MPTHEAPAEGNKTPVSATPDAETANSTEETAITGSILGLDTFSARDLEPREPAPAEPERRTDATQEQNSPGTAAREASPLSARSSRWVDYDTHELMEMIGELEDERRWSRLREGTLWAVIVHFLLLSALTWIPKYVFRAPKIIDPFDAIKQHEEQTYLDQLPDALRQIHKPKLPANKPLIDKQTMEDLKRQAEQAPPPAPAQQPPAPAPPQQQAAQPPPPTPQSPAPEAPHPQAVPARPNFAMGAANPSDQLRQDMLNAMRGQGQQQYNNLPSGRLSMHPGAGTGGVQVLSDTQGVDFSAWLQRWHFITERTWDPLIPDSVNPPISEQGVVAIRFKVLPNGQVVDMRLDGRSGDTGLDRAAWGAISGSSYPSLPRDFHGPYLELRAYFLYNEQPQ